MIRPPDQTGNINLPPAAPQPPVPKPAHRDYLAELDARIAHCQACARRRLNPHHCDVE